jgi:hypothetical protein
MGRCPGRSPSPPRPRSVSGSASGSGSAGLGWPASGCGSGAASFYVDGELDGGELLPLCRLRYGGSASLWGFALYLASNDGYQDSVLRSGLPVGAPGGGPGLRLRALPR